MKKIFSHDPFYIEIIMVSFYLLILYLGYDWIRDNVVRRIIPEKQKEAPKEPTIQKNSN